MAKPLKKTELNDSSSEDHQIDVNNEMSFRQVLFRPPVLLFLALAVLSTMLIPLVNRMLPDLTVRDEFRLSPRKVEITELPHWVPQDFVDQVIDFSEFPEELILLDDDVTETVAEAFQRHPWVAEVISVRKSIPARIEVELLYRKPVAMVQVKQGMYPIDAEGSLLPPGDFSVADTKQYPLIVQVTSTPQGTVGSGWGDVTVVAAAQIAELLAAYWKEFELSAIQVPRRTSADVEVDDFIFRLKTRGGSTIIWGRAPESSHPGELSADQKIGRLRKYLSDFGDFDSPHGPYEIDIRHWQEISRRPITAGSPRTRR